MQKTYRLNDLTKEEYDELKSCEDIDFALIENHPIANSQVTDDYGNQIEELQYTYTVILKIRPTTEEKEQRIEKYIDSFTTGGRDHRVDRFSKEYDYLKQELGVGKYKRRSQRRSIPHTLGEALPEIADKIEQEMLKENLGLKDYTND